MSGNAAPSAWDAGALADVMGTIAVRLEARGLDARGRVTLTRLTREARQALGGILGRQLVTGRIVVDLGDLDVIARERFGLPGGIVEACESALSRRLVDLPSQRARQRQVRDEPLEHMRAMSTSWPERPVWVSEWIEDVARNGLLARAPQPLATAEQAVRLVGMLTTADGLDAPRPTRIGRNELAARYCGDAHGLDEGSVLAAIVMRGLAHSLSRPAPRSAPERRDLWGIFEVDPDTVSITVLSTGLRFDSDDPLALRLDLAASHQDPVHLTARNVLALADLQPATTEVLVCENPRILEAAAEHLRPHQGVVVTMGNPARVVIDLLGLLARGGCRLDYHGDFDWAGLTIAARVMKATGARPWQMQAEDYLAAVVDRRGVAQLEGAPAPSPWDPDLADAMVDVGLAIHEEALLPRLVCDWSRHSE